MEEQKIDSTYGSKPLWYAPIFENYYGLKKAKKLAETFQILLYLYDTHLKESLFLYVRTVNRADSQ